MKKVISILLICMMLTSVAFAANTSIVEYITSTNEETGVTTVTATALATGVGEDEVKLFTAVYNDDGSLAGAKKASADADAVLKNSVTLGEGQTIKSFAWEGDSNTPVEMPATYGKTAFTEADVEITFGGKSFEEYTGSALAFDSADHVAEYTVTLAKEDIGADGNITIPAPAVALKDNTISYNVENDEENLTTTIKIKAGRNATVDSTVTKKTRYIYAPISEETIVIKYVMGNMFTEELATKQKYSQYLATGSYQLTKAFSYDYTIPAGTYRDITIDAATLSRSSVVVLVPVDKSKEVVVEKKDGEYTAVQWTKDVTSKGEAYSIESYNYDTDDGTPLANGYDASKAVASDVNTTAATIEKNGVASSATLIRKWTENDGTYVAGSRVTSATYPSTTTSSPANARTTWTSIPDALEGCTVIVGNHTSGTANNKIKFSVNDNLDKIVIFTNAKSGTGYSYTSTDGTVTETYAEEKAYSIPAYTYQSIQPAEFPMVNFTLSYHIAKGTFTEEELEVISKSAFIFRKVDTLEFLKDNTYDLNEELASEELVALYKDYKNVDYSAMAEYWFFGDIVFENNVDFVTDLTLLAPAEYVSTVDSSKTQTLDAPQIKKFSSENTAWEELAYVLPRTNNNLPGLTLSYPQWLEAEDIIYIAPAYYWSGIPSGCYYGDEVFDNATASDVYSFKVTQDATVMMFTNKSPTNFWADSEGWSKSPLSGSNRILLNRQIGTANREFIYVNLYTKDVPAGTTVVIKTPQATESLPLVFVKRADR